MSHSWPYLTNLGNLKKPGDLRLTVVGIHVEQDAAYAGFKPNKTPGPNARGYLLSLDYQLTENTFLNLTRGAPERLNGPFKNQGWKYYALEMKHNF